MNVRTVTLEILRHGPPHNQLLSPLTQYLALSGGYQAISLQLPWEHARFLRELRTLRYGASRTRTPDLEGVGTIDRADISRQVAHLFESVPGLIAGLAPNGATQGTLTHLRLIFSAAELALIPFEMSSSPRGFPAEGSDLSMQPVTPLVITREIRGAQGHSRRWPRVPRLLFAWAEPAGQSAVPWRAHLQALVSALRPWTGRHIAELPEQAESSLATLKEHLTVLPRATLRSIADACAANEYTHVHLLAHGGRRLGEDEEGFSVLLHAEGDPSDTDRVSPERLTSALTGQLASPCSAESTFSRPTVVTLATCDSGNQGGVVVPGSSLIHCIHAAGIPLVVGSLFPLSKSGSVTFTEVLYRGLFQGDDPRAVLHATRQALRNGDVNTHDWASLVAYASFSPLLDSDVVDACYTAAKQSVHKTNRRIERLVMQDIEENAAQTPEARAALNTSFDRLIEDLDVAARRMPRTGRYEIEGRGMLGSYEKRKAEAHFAMALREIDERARQRRLEKSYAALVNSRAHYLQAAKPRANDIADWKDGAPSWVLTQALCLDAVLGRHIPFALWRGACSRALIDLDGDERDRGWANGALLELCMLADLLTGDWDNGFITRVQAENQMSQSVKLVRKAALLDPFILESTRRQVRRYATWWNHDHWLSHPPLRPRRTTCWAKVTQIAAGLLQELEQGDPSEPLPSPPPPNASNHRESAAAQPTSKM